jgi:hypothetical protein
VGIFQLARPWLADMTITILEKFKFEKLFQYIFKKLKLSFLHYTSGRNIKTTIIMKVKPSDDLYRKEREKYLSGNSTHSIKD